MKKLGHLSYRISHILYLADCRVSFNMFFYPPFNLAYPQAWPDSSSIILAITCNRWWCIRYIFGSVVGLNSELMLPTDVCWVLIYYRSFPIVKTNLFFAYNIWKHRHLLKLNQSFLSPLSFWHITLSFAKKSDEYHTLSSVTKIPLFALNKILGEVQGRTIQLNEPIQ